MNQTLVFFLNPVKKEKILDVETQSYEITGYNEKEEITHYYLSDREEAVNWFCFDLIQLSSMGYMCEPVDRGEDKYAVLCIKTPKTQYLLCKNNLFQELCNLNEEECVSKIIKQKNNDIIKNIVERENRTRNLNNYLKKK